MVYLASASKTESSKSQTTSHGHSHLIPPAPSLSSRLASIWSTLETGLTSRYIFLESSPRWRSTPKVPCSLFRHALPKKPGYTFLMSCRAVAYSLTPSPAISFTLSHSRAREHSSQQAKLPGILCTVCGKDRNIIAKTPLSLRGASVPRGLNPPGSHPWRSHPWRPYPCGGPSP